MGYQRRVHGDTPPEAVQIQLKDIMKTFILLLCVVAAVSANAIGETCKTQKIGNLLLKTALKNVAHYDPQSTGCGTSDVVFCTAELAGTIAACIAAGLTFGAELVGCISAAIGAGHTCYDCICAVLQAMGISC